MHHAFVFFQYPSVLQFAESCGASLYVIKPPHVARPFLSIIDWTVHASFSTDALIFSLSLFRWRPFLFCGKTYTENNTKFYAVSYNVF
jgi:hypothetical protein